RSPQDVEWAIDHDGTVWLLQSRPITTLTGTATGPVLGTGPLAETFPEPLSPLEVDLWLRPLGEGVEQALLLTGTASARALRRSPVVREGDGWPVADLVRLGLAPERPRRPRRRGPRPPPPRGRPAGAARPPAAPGGPGRRGVAPRPPRPGAARAGPGRRRGGRRPPRRRAPAARAVQRRAALGARQRAHRAAGAARLRGPGRHARAGRRRD